jgi:hypothetical protein
VQLAPVRDDVDEVVGMIAEVVVRVLVARRFVARKSGPGDGQYKQSDE